MKAEMGGAFLLSWMVLGMGGLGTASLAGAVVVAVAWMAFSGAHLLPAITWSHIMTGDLGDAEGNWMANGTRLLAQVIGALLAVVLMTEAGSKEGLPDFAATEMWITSVGDNLWGVIGMVAAGAVWWQVHNRCDSAWASAFAIMALGGMMGLDGAHQMGSSIADGGTQIVDVLADWICDGLFVGIGAFVGCQVDTLIGEEE